MSLQALGTILKNVTGSPEITFLTPPKNNPVFVTGAPNIGDHSKRLSPNTPPTIEKATRIIHTWMVVIDIGAVGGIGRGVNVYELLVLAGSGMVQSAEQN